MIESLSNFDEEIIRRINHAEIAQNSIRETMDILLSHPPFDAELYLQQLQMWKGVTRIIDGLLNDLAKS